MTWLESGLFTLTFLISILRLMQAIIRGSARVVEAHSKKGAQQFSCSVAVHARTKQHRRMFNEEQ
jgi:hypothetical protein